jgi:hypothetical protein
MGGRTVWPDTREALPPSGLYAATLWLLGRHRALAELVDRIPGAVDVGEDDPWLDLDVVARALDEHAAHVRASVEYERTHRAPGEDDAIEAWRAAGPQPTPGAEAVGAMSGSEQVRVRLLATLARDGARVRVADFARLDDDGRELLRDWQTAALMVA